MPLTRIDSAFLDLDAIGGIDFDVNNNIPTFKVDATTHRVGIGHNSPETQLHMFGSYPTLKIQNSATAQYASASIDLQGPAGDERYTKILHGNSNTGGTETYFQIEQYNGSGAYVKQIAHYSYEYDYWAFSTGAAGTEKLRIASDGNVGIATNSNLTAKLTVGNIENTGVTNKGATAFKTLNSSGGVGESAIYIEEQSGNEGWYLKVNSSGDLQFNDSGEADRITFKDGGNVGIGTNDPTNMLEIYGSTPTIELTDSDTGVIHRINANSGAGIFYFDNDINNIGSDGSYIFRHGHLNGGGTVLAISAAGTLTLGANSGTIRRSGDTDTYINFMGNDQIRFVTANSEQLRIDASGNIGIGTDDPEAPLHVRQGSALDRTAYLTKAADTNFRLTAANGSGTNSSGEETARFGMNYASTNAWGEYIKFVRGTGSANGSMGLYSSDTERIHIKADGNVGIGTDNPSGKLHVVGDSLFLSSTGNGTVNIVSSNNQTDAGNKIAFFAANRFDTDEEMAYIQPLLTGNSGGAGNVQTGHLAFGTSGAERLRITSTGRVGIGSQTPTSKLDVVGTVTATALTTTGALTISNDSPSLIFNESDTTTGARLIVSAGKLYIQVAASGSGTSSSSGDIRITGYNAADINSLTVKYGGAYNTIWHAGNDGSGSGLDADTLDGYQLSGDDSISTKIFNNKGRTHGAVNDFNTSMNPGPNYLQGGTNGPTGTSSHQWYGFMLGLGSGYGTTTGSSGHYASQLYWGRQAQTSSNPYLWARDLESGTWGSWRKFSAGDSDTLDGIDSGSFLRSDAADTASSKITFSNGFEVTDVNWNTGLAKITGAAPNIEFSQTDGIDWQVGANGTAFYILDDSDQDGSYDSAPYPFQLSTTSLHINGQTVWHTGNDGSGSGLDADTVDGIQASSFLRSDTADTFSGDLTSSGSARILLKKNDNNVSDHIQFFNGTTRVGEIGCEDTSWLRINQETAKNIYTPRYIRADGGFFVDGSTKGINGSGNFIGGTIAGASDYGTLLRSNASDQYDGQTSGRVLRFRCVDGRNAGSTSSSLFPLELYQSSNTTNSDAAMTFHIAGRYAAYFGLDRQTNDLFFGGWSRGAAKYKVWHAANDGSGSGLDADLLDGQQGSYYINTSTTQSSNLYIRNGGPTIYLRDNNHRSSMVHCNSNLWYVLRGSGTDSTTWQTTGGHWPLVVNLENNNVTIGGNGFINGTTSITSDERLKTDIQPITGALETVKALRGVTYYRTDMEPDKLKSGLIAQEVEPVLPHIVDETVQHEPGTGEVLEDTRFKCLAYEELHPYLIEAIKEQQALIEALTARIDALENP